MTIMDMVHQGNFSGLAIMAVIIAGILTMMWFFNRELKKSHEEKKNDQPVVSTIIRQTGNDAVTAAISAAVNEYRKK